MQATLLLSGLSFSWRHVHIPQTNLEQYYIVCWEIGIYSFSFLFFHFNITHEKSGTRAYVCVLAHKPHYKFNYS